MVPTVIGERNQSIFRFEAKKKITRPSNRRDFRRLMSANKDSSVEHERDMLKKLSIEGIAVRRMGKVTDTIHMKIIFWEWEATNLKSKVRNNNVAVPRIIQVTTCINELGSGGGVWLVVPRTRQSRTNGRSYSLRNVNSLWCIVWPFIVWWTISYILRIRTIWIIY